MPSRTTRTTRTTTTRRRGVFGRSKHGKHHSTKPTTTHHRRKQHHTTTASRPVHHQKRHATLGDKISGAMLKLKGTLTRRPGEKAAGTRRMHGTDGRRSHRANRRH